MNPYSILPILKYPLFIFGFSFLIYSCNPTKHLKPNEVFLKKVKVKQPHQKLDREDILNLVKQKPNRKLLGMFRFHLGVHNLFKESSSSRIKEKIGEAPVIYDSLSTKRSVRQLKLYLNNKGYYESKVTHKEIITGKRRNKIKIVYNLESGPPYLIKKITYQFDDKIIGSYIEESNKKSLLKIGKPIDINVLDDERERIKRLLKNNGYYYFNKDFIKYEVDSTIGGKNVNILLKVSNRQDKNLITDSTKSLGHERYYINKINVFLSDDFKNQALQDFDTVSYKGITLFYNEKLKFKPKMLRHAIGMTTSNLYLLSDHESTYKHLSELNLFKSIAIQFEKVANNKLNNNILLVPQAINSVAIETIGTHSGGNLGIEGNISYQNKNVFQKGDRLTIKMKGGIEAQQLISSSSEDVEIIDQLPFNTFEIGPEISLAFPRFFLPISLEKFSKRANPKTTIVGALNFQQRPEYVRSLAKFSFGYNWNESKFKRHIIIPIDVSLIKLDLTDEFQARINTENNPFIINSYTNHFITSTIYTFVYNNQEINKIKNFTYLRFNTEFSGNLLTAYNLLSNTSRNIETNSFDFLEIRYAQYIKTDIDLRFYDKKPLYSFVKRLAIGVGVPYGNLNVLPFEKSYFGGGANGLRAWTSRSLGPGSLPDSLAESAISRIGELKIEGNLEYRFNITKLFEGAAFIDAGNIWILKPDEKRPNAEIKLSRFWNDIAIDVGLGLRLNFNFFIVRFDVAAPIKDPAYIKPQLIKLDLQNPNLNIGIGYPF